MKKIFVCVAPVAASDPLINPRAIARDVYDCYKAGAAMVHLHVRDLNGRLTPSLALLEETAAYIREMCDIIIEISTGGVSDLTIEERVQPCYAPWVEATSLNVGSVNLGEAVYANPIKDVRYCVKQIVDNGKIPETELFELGMANTLRELDERFHLPKPLLIALVFGHPGEMPSTVPALKHMIEGLYDNFPKDSVKWGYTQAHREDFEMVKTALDMGADALRIGFEDSDYLTPEKRVDSNAALIEETVRIIKEKGMEPMTPDEGREMLHIPMLNKNAGFVSFARQECIKKASEDLDEMVYEDLYEGFSDNGPPRVTARNGSLQECVPDVRHVNKQAVIEEVVRRTAATSGITSFQSEGYVKVPAVPGREMMGVHTLNDREERIFLKEFTRSPYVKDIIVQGGSSQEAQKFIAELREKGRNVTVLPEEEKIVRFMGQTFIESVETADKTLACDLFITIK